MHVRILNLVDRRCKQIFQEKVEEYVKATNIEEKLSSINHSRVTPRKLIAADDFITHILNAIR